MASLIALLEAGTTPWRREWDAAAGGHHVNLLSGRRYRGANPLLLTLGLHLRGEARLVEAGRVDGSGVGGDGSGQPSAGAGHSWVSYRPVALFNAADLEGEALEGLIQKRRQVEGAVLRPEPERLADAEAVLSRWPVPVSFAGDRACYLPVPDRIQLPDRTAFHSAGALYATWAHEAIHSSGHSSRLARDPPCGMG
ncbi:MAG: zincin-like metallopeptidase domain-containing protein, partial [Cyanobium sp.]